jgi:hypothetical protein
MGRQWNTIIESLGPLTGGSMSISANLTDIEALLTTLQADVADGIIITGGTVTSTETRSTSGGTGPTTITSITYATAAVANSSRKGLAIYNEGTGALHLTLGTSATTTSFYSVKLNSGDYYEVPSNYTGLVGYIFATAGTGRVTELV